MSLTCVVVLTLMWVVPLAHLLTQKWHQSPDSTKGTTEAAGSVAEKATTTIQVPCGGFVEEKATMMIQYTIALALMWMIPDFPRDLTVEAGSTYLDV